MTEPRRIRVRLVCHLGGGMSLVRTEGALEGPGTSFFASEVRVPTCTIPPDLRRLARRSS